MLVLAVEESKVTPGVLGFLVVALLGVATYLLIRSMNRQIGRIDLPEDRSEGGGAGSTEDGGSASGPVADDAPEGGPAPR